jgi:integrase
LKVGDLDLEEGILTVACGKGGKRRRVGISSEVVALLKEHLLACSNLTESPLFLDRFGQPLRRDGLLNRIRRIGKDVGVEASPHALRRAFVTINANKGRSLVMLQIACGHSDIKATRSYCQTSEDEVIQAMKEW